MEGVVKRFLETISGDSCAADYVQELRRKRADHHYDGVKTILGEPAGAMLLDIVHLIAHRVQHCRIHIELTICD